MVFVFHFHNLSNQSKDVNIFIPLVFTLAYFIDPLFLNGTCETFYEIDYLLKSATFRL